MSNARGAGDPWSEFWSSKDSARGGCLPARSAGIDTCQRETWQELARTMPKGGRVLDLATGDGRVMGWLLGARRDLKCLGVDLAANIPAPPKGSRSRGATAMEALPVGNASQDLVTSQFGFEYGDLDAVLNEIKRVLKPGGRAALMTHRLDGPILEHNLRRRQGLLWALNDAKLIEVARTSVALRSLAPGVAPAVRAAPQEAKRLFGPGSAGWELAEAIVQTLTLGANDHPQSVRGLLDTLGAKASAEISRIGSLQRACQAISDEAALVRRFREAGLIVMTQQVLEEADGARPFAGWWILRRDTAAS